MTVSFKDLVLPPATKLALQDVTTLPLLRPELFDQGILRRANFSGVLLFGPPGTGKTMLAKCVAQAGSARFMNVALSDVFDKYVGEGEKNVKAVFTLARKLAPCVVFLDEVDALFGRRRGDGFASRREVINEFMGEWEGLQSHENRGIVVMAATNRPFDLDEAVLRRMPRRILVDLPTEAAREKILATHLRDEVVDASVSLADVAKDTPLYSGSDLRNVGIAAALAAVKENIVREGMGLPSLGEQADIDADLELGRPSRVLTKEHFGIALREIPASITDETDVLVELRKWDKQFGSGSTPKDKAKRVWGFAQADDGLAVQRQAKRGDERR
ncbi:AAA-domain-containing protein [Gonapodya prolifera JEL478]|uniref:AAA-domain-containing protein n=1 Tax=Gonapodya prolifera (strain JEL478) TaxID=1344416 RepID=A0A138ZX01_GONPJ|nr:AAA-domain-containing protein [Gonapodya prolifera JEL478]|eukprot:KXS09026.1 AAA-domain-containing protein [Gonapodya prolifera JEL478]